MRADLLLNWMSEVGSGDVRELRQRIAWAARSADLYPRPRDTGRWLRDVSSLGHAEIDWANGRWAIAPAVATLAPGAAGAAVLVGQRRTGLLERLEDVFAVHVEEHESSHDAPLCAPSSVYVQSDSIDTLRSDLAELGIAFVGCAARNIAGGLSPIGLGDLAASPSRSDVVEHLTLTEDWYQFSPGLPAADGLCRFTALGRPSYLFRSGNSWHHTDHATGILLELARCGLSVIRWRPERTVAGQEIGTAFVDQGAPLPPLQARALVLCSGLPTRFGRTAGTAIYPNVPKEIVELVGESIRQRVAVIS